MSDFKAKCTRNAGAPSQTPPGELTAFSRPPSSILGTLLLREEREWERRGRTRRERGRREREWRGPTSKEGGMGGGSGRVREGRERGGKWKYGREGAPKGWLTPLYSKS